MSKINVTRSSMPGFEEYCEEIRELWESRWLTNMGDKHRSLEAKLKEYLKVENLKLYVNGHLALENALEVLGLPEGAEIITTPFTFASTPHAIVRCGFKPIMCDIDPVDFTIDVTKLEALITDKTAAILPVHVYGNLCNVKEIQRIADKYGLRVIYDAAHAFAVEYEGVSAVAFGDISMLSFHATKVFNSIEGGALIYGDGSLSRKLDMMKNFGISGLETVECVGGNAKMNELCAAMGLCNLRHIDEEIQKRRAVAERYDCRLSGVKGIVLSPAQHGVKRNYAYYPAVFDGYKYSRDEIYDRLAQNGIFARKYFYPLVNDYDAYRGTGLYGSDKTPVAKRIAENILTLPIYADLSLSDVDKICNMILQ